MNKETQALENRESEWMLTVCANKRKSCEAFHKDSDEIFEVLRFLEQYFDIVFAQKVGLTGECFGVKTKINGETVIFGWDIWSGVYIMAEDVKGDSMIEQIYNYLNYKTKEVDKYE